MKIFKAFAHIGPLVDNALDVVAPIGELSPMSKTFTRRPTANVTADYPNETLVGFSYIVDEVPTVVDDATAYSCLTAINWTYSQARLGTFTTDKDSYQQPFITQFGQAFDFIGSGIMIQFGNYWCPEYIDFCLHGQSATSLWRVWFADDSFYNQYDEYLIFPVTPIVNLDLFFGDFDDVTALVKAIKQTEIFGRISDARGKFPETVLRNDVFTWQDKNDHSLKIDTDWVTVIYGAAGDNLDAVREAIRDYILDHSTHTRDEWAEIFPDLFTSTEFIWTPMWTKIAIPNEVRETGVYSGITSIQDAMLLCHKTCQGVKYTNDHIDLVLSVVPTNFRSLMCAVVGGPENRDGIDLFVERYPDYINVPTTHPDFMRMTQETRNLVLMIAEMLMYAEEMTPNTGVPHGYNRLTRNGVVYVAKSYEKFLYLVVSQYSVKAAGV